jgi:iron complex transport system substrate-binding protein
LPQVYAIAEVRWIFGKSILEGVRQGRIREIGAPGKLDAEGLLASQVGVGMAHQSPTGDERFPSHGPPSFTLCEWLETHPLGRAEWIRAVGRLTGKAALADSLYSEIAGRYHRLSATAQSWASKHPRPIVLSGAVYQGVWHIPGGQSYKAKLIQDAGGHYPWADDTHTGSVALSMEAVMPLAFQADLWESPGDAAKLQDLIRSDDRYALFPAFKKQRVFNNDARTGANGANDYWQSGVLRPDQVLADFIRIVQSPDSAESPPLHYYRRLPRE